MGSETEISIGIFTTDTNLVVRVWDAALERMTGIRAEAAVGKRLAEVIPDLVERSLLPRFDRALAQGTVEVLAPAFHRYLIRCAPPVGSKRFPEMRQRVKIAPLAEGQTIHGLIVTVEDVTARMERELGLAEQLSSPDESVRLEAARTIGSSEEPLSAENSASVIAGLEDSSWRVRRSLVEGMTRRAAPEAIEALLLALREKHLDFGTVNGALQILREHEIDTSGSLIEFLRAEETDLRMHAALALGEHEELSAASALISALNDPDVNVRYHVIEALGKLRATEAVAPLLAVAESRDFFLSFAALDALAEIGDGSVSGRIVLLLDDDLLREAALRTIGRVGGSTDIGNVVELLNDDVSLAPVVAAAAVEIFSRHCGLDEGVRAIIDKAREAVNSASLTRLSEVLGSANKNDLPALIEFAGWFDDESLREKLVDLLRDSDMRERAASALAMQGANSVEALIDELGSEEPEIREAAATALGRVGDPRAVEPLAELLEDGTVSDRRAALHAMIELGGPEAVQLLENLLASEDPHGRELALRGLGRLGGREHADAIASSCKDPDERVRQAAIELLPEVIGDAAVPEIVEALRSGTPRVRAKAAQSLTRIAGSEAIAALREALGDPDAWTRYFAVRGVGELKDAASVETLREMAESDAAEQVRVAARETLVELGV
jgi:HEAT repeat protein